MSCLSISPRRSRTGESDLLPPNGATWPAHYSPEKLELYLLDFKGSRVRRVFCRRAAATRAIISRADREFGLSGLRKFYEEIDRRAWLCRESGTTNLPECSLEGAE